MAGATTEDSDQSLKRKNAFQACNTCRSRKQRCDTRQPRCSNCEQQGLECQYEAASKKAHVSESYVHKLLTRIGGLEGELEQARRAITQENAQPEQTLEFSPTHLTLAPEVDQAAHGTPLLRSSDSQLPLNPDSTEVQARPAKQNRIEEQPLSTSPRNNLALMHESSHNNRPGRRSTDTSPAEFVRARLYGDLDAEATSYGLEEYMDHTSLDVNLHMWPQRFLADKLVDNFYELLYPQYPFLHGPSFRARYEASWTTTSAPHNIWAGTVNLVFALGAHCTNMPPEFGKQFFLRARALISPHMMAARSLDSLQALILLSFYLQSTNRTTEAWNVIGTAVRVAQALELHNSDASNAGRTVFEQESKKRAWWGCFLLDSVICLQLGRRSVFGKQPFPIELPACVDDEDLLSHSRQSVDFAHRRHLEEGSSSFMCFFIATIQLSHFMHEVVESFEQPEDQHRIFEIDRKMCTWLTQLPSHFLPDSPASTNKRLKRQKEILMTRFLHLRLLLHRSAIARPDLETVRLAPFFTMSESLAGQMYRLRSEICVKLAVAIIDSIAGSNAPEPTSAWWYDLTYIFSAATVVMTLKVNKPADQYIAQKAQLALDFMTRMRDQGRELASDCLRLVEKYRLRAPTTTTGEAGPGSAPIDVGGNLPTMPLPNLSARQDDWSSRTIDPWLIDLSHPWNVFDEEFVRGDHTAY